MICAGKARRYLDYPPFFYHLCRNVNMSIVSGGEKGIS